MSEQQQVYVFARGRDQKPADTALALLLVPNSSLRELIVALDRELPHWPEQLGQLVVLRRLPLYQQRLLGLLQGKSPADGRFSCAGPQDLQQGQVHLFHPDPDGSGEPYFRIGTLPLAGTAQGLRQRLETSLGILETPPEQAIVLAEIRGFNFCLAGLANMAIARQARARR